MQQQAGSLPTSRIDSREREQHGGLVFPTMLVALGIIFLLNNLGLVSWDVWGSIWQLWPVLLIAVGLDLLIGRRSTLSSLFVALTLLVVILGGVWLWATQQANWQPSSNEQITQRLDGATRGDVVIEFGVGTLNLSALSGSTTDLITGSVDLGKGERTYIDYRPVNGTAYYHLRTDTTRIFVPFWETGSNKKTWELGLNPDVPMSLKVSAGVGTAAMDLTGLDLTKLEVDAGAGNVAITLPRVGELQALVKAGVGKVEINIPAGMAARINISEGLGRVRVEGGYERHGDTYVGPTYNSAESRLELEVEGGVGQITIRETAND
jgi:hypothetical protein